MKIERTYYQVDAEDSEKSNISPSAATKFKRGDLVMVALRVSATKRNAYFQIEDPILPGFSVERQDSIYYSSSYKIEYDSRQIYDDNVTFFVSGPSASFTIRYFLRAQLPGKYRALPATAQLMYFPDVNGATATQTFEVAK